MSDDPKSPLTRDHVVWAYRLLLDRDPENEDVIGPKLAGSRDTAELRRHLMTSAEFQEKNRDYAHTNDRTLVIKELEHGVRLFVDLSDHVIGLNIVRGHYEEDEARFARSVLKPGDIAIDAGAHIGFFTMQMAAAVGEKGAVYAFEPFDANADLLERSIRENHFEDRIVFRRAAVGASSGTATLDVPPRNAEHGRCVPAARRDIARRRQPDKRCARGGAGRFAAPAARPVHQDGRRRRRAARDEGGCPPAPRRPARRPFGAPPDAARSRIGH